MKLLPIVLGFFLLVLLVPSVFAAAPDGLGPWADTVVSSTQGLRKDGNPVIASRSDPTSALGVAEGTNADGTFYSLGFGGVITLGFTNGISSGVLVVEATNLPYPTETALVEVSEDGVIFEEAGNVSQDGTVSVPESVDCAKFVRITDTSTPADFPNDADGYDLDGVEAQGQSCTAATPTPTMTPTVTPTRTPTPTPGGTGGCGCGNITQTNTSTVVNGVSVSNKTGKNKAKDNTGTTKVKSGNAVAVVDIKNGGNSNTASNNCCCEAGTVNATISNNGRNSNNSININKGKKNNSL